MDLLDAESDAFAAALAFGEIGLAFLDDDLAVVRRIGRLSDWLPLEGESACASPFLLNMEEKLASLRAENGEILFPCLRMPAKTQARANISIRYSAEKRRYLVITTAAHGADLVDRLFAPERREQRLLQQQAEAAAARLRLADALYRDIVESSEFFVLRFGVDLKVVFANRRAAAFLGLPQDALIGRPIGDLFPPLGLDDPWRIEVAAQGAANFEMAAHDAEGALRWLGWSVHFLGAEGGGEFQAVARDATASRLLRIERGKAREEARAAAVANERLRIAHDLHDTLVRSVVAMIAQTRLIAKTTGDEKTKAALRELESQGREGLREAREAIERIRVSRREEDDLRVIVAQFAARRGDETMKIEFEFNFGERELPREAEELFAQVLREALRNVELHSGAQRVRISFMREERAARLIVWDDGVGFDPDAATPGHFGVDGMLERARGAGATLTIDSARGGGTLVTLVAPVPD